MRSWFPAGLTIAFMLATCAAAAAADGPARLFSPVVPKPPGATPAEELPLMYYMPGIDGNGLAAYMQFPRLTRAFDLRCLIIPRTDRSSFEELVDTVAVSSSSSSSRAGATAVALVHVMCTVRHARSNSCTASFSGGAEVVVSLSMWAWKGCQPVTHR
jgi:hypothetical protein